MKKINLFIVFILTLCLSRVHAQKLTPSETDQLRNRAKELTKIGSQNMIEFMSTGDTSFFNLAVSSWQESKAGIKE